ncbi:hypothetical protein [Leclercia sp. UBA1284]|uniref:hypothetical protein n=1 Tax=Leclercia sp. UBA1284 TaxID=1946737 RepID=UPI00257F2F01|nr:hypothetical protein [Leclercia sp. UBA1284]
MMAMNDCPTTLYPKESGLSVSFNFLKKTPLRRGFLLFTSRKPRLGGVFALACFLTCNANTKKIIPLGTQLGAIFALIFEKPY